MVQQNATSDLVADLRDAIGAQHVKFDHMTRLLYSTDASNYMMTPVGVTFPRDGDDVVAIHHLANKHGVPVLPRGGGSSLAGQTVNTAIVMDFSRHMRRVRGVNADEHSVTVEPGLVLDQLNAQLTSLGLMYGPDPASADRATIGGCIGNNASGSHSIVYGMTSNHIKRLEVVLASGERVWLDADTESLRQLRDQIGKLATHHASEIKTRYPKTWRDASGYALNKIDPHAVDLKYLFAGSEGSLGTIVQAELNLVPIPTRKRLAMVHFDSVRASLEATPRILEVEPSAVELMDRFLMQKTREHSEFAPLLSFVDGDPAAVLIVEFYGETRDEVESKVDSLTDLLRNTGHLGAITHAVTPEEQAKVWKVRKAGLGLLMSERRDAKPLAFIEDAAVPVERLADYIDDVDEIVSTARTEYAIYAHASAGCLHVRPLINLKTAEGYHQYRFIAEEISKLVLKYEGAITGEHGKGIARGEFAQRMFGDELYGAFKQIKSAFDPDNLMNPGKVVDTPAMDDASLMRYSPEYDVIPIKTRFDWSLDGGLNGAAEMCNGAGVCRKEGSGTMCPSYMATLDEAHATRGRANALRLAMSGKLGKKGLTSEEVHDVFDLCLSCKACQAECPSAVDVAKMKSEWLTLYHDEHGTPLSTQLFANIHRVSALASLVPALSNFMLDNPLGQWGMKLVGLPTDRTLPKYAPQRFTKQTANGAASAPQATLIVDTFTEYNHPEVGLAFLKIVDKLGVNVRVMRLPGQGCCGRPAISKGVLDLGKRLATENVRELSQRLDDAPFVFLEPSCMSAFTDDYLTLVDGDLQGVAVNIAGKCLSAEQWLLEQLDGASLTWDDTQREILLHGHCHQKALWGTTETLNLLRTIPNATVTEIDSGCCGVAGSFGYEHYDLSMKIGSQRLLPAVEAKPDALVAAPGTSCRAQVGDAGHHARVFHPVEVVANALV